jgi:glycosyltransferase involved in cell wall biosynthesis
VNDGSTDKTNEILRQYETKGLIKLYETENRGLGAARNLGLQAASGDYIYFFDSDDCASPILVETFLNTLKDEPTLDLFCFSGKSFFDEGFVSNYSPEYNRKIQGVYEDGKRAFASTMANGTFYPSSCLYLYRRALHSNNKSLHFKQIIHEDEEFTVKLFMSAGKTVISNDVLFFRRIRSGSIMTRERNLKNIKGYLVAIRSINELIKKSITAEDEYVVRMLILRKQLLIREIVKITKQRDCDIGLFTIAFDDTRYIELLASDIRSLLKYIAYSIYRKMRC